MQWGLRAQPGRARGTPESRPASRRSPGPEWKTGSVQGEHLWAAALPLRWAQGGLPPPSPACLTWCRALFHFQGHKHLHHRDLEGREGDSPRVEEARGLGFQAPFT